MNEGLLRGGQWIKNCKGQEDILELLQGRKFRVTVLLLRGGKMTEPLEKKLQEG